MGETGGFVGLRMENMPRTIAVEKQDGVPVVKMIDQRRLPEEEMYLVTSDWRTVVDAIKTLAVRGAPAIGVAGAAAVMLRAWEFVAAGAGTGTPAMAPVLGSLEREDNASVSAPTTGEAMVDASAAERFMCQRRGQGGCAAADEADGFFDRPFCQEVACRALDGHRTFVLDDEGCSSELFLMGLEFAARQIASARPTAVNLSWAVQRAVTLAQQLATGEGQGPVAVAEALFELCEDMVTEDEAINRSIGANGAALLPANATVLTHCNAGSLATAFYGTALGVVYSAFEQGRLARVYADETRPVGQGARLTAWELAQAGVPVTLICDNMAASVMAQGKIDAVVVGADRIAANGDVANKIGTLGVAVLAHHFGIPFYVAAPCSTIDANMATGESIVIEQRDHSEVLPRGLAGVDVENPAFDVTPARLATAIITEKGVYAPGHVVDALS